MNDTVIASFRTVINGFHKGDVAAYISATAEEHRKQLQQFQLQIDELQAENDRLNACLMDTQHDWTDSIGIQTGHSDLGNVQTDNLQALELAAYRRAESAERLAMTRARRMSEELDRVSSRAQATYAAAEDKAIEIIHGLEDQIVEMQKLREEMVNCFTENEKILYNLGCYTGEEETEEHL